MKTLICQQPGVMEYVEKDIPTPADNEVLLKIKAVGICGTDIHAFAGRQPFFSYPRVLGHEICAEAVSRGSQCQIAQSGQRYSVIPCIPCGKCAACRKRKRTAANVFRCMACIRMGVLVSTLRYVKTTLCLSLTRSATVPEHWLNVSPLVHMPFVGRDQG